VRDDAFVERVSRAEAALAHAVETVIGNGQLGEGAVARALVSAMPVGSVLVVGNSLPVRQLDLVCPGRLGDFTVVSQRGVSGIDGLIAGAAGAAAAARRPTVAYVGDVSFLHDVGGLLTARGLGTPFCIVVANNDGGRIFEQLPVARLDLSSSSLARFTTPHGLSFGDAASLYGHRYAKAETPSSLRDAIDAALAQPGCTVVEALVPSSAARTEADALRAAAESALAVLDPETHG
jgi:2-succinyl-5-enolpyruvyl-6-hydroxy-3-cyclohexene-1-carboxylate synthase